MKPTLTKKQYIKRNGFHAIIPFLITFGVFFDISQLTKLDGWVVEETGWLILSILFTNLLPIFAYLGISKAYDTYLKNRQRT